jgi:hypothetical protein
MEFIQTKIIVGGQTGAFLDEKIYLSSEEKEELTDKQMDFYACFKKNDIKVDLRSFKKKMAYCPNMACQYRKKKFGGVGGFAQ